MIRACLSLLAGAYAPHFTSFETNSDLIVFGCILAAMLMSVAGRLAALSFLAGLLLFTAVTSHVTASRLDQRYEGDSMLSVLRIVDFPRQTGASLSFVAAPVADARIPSRVRISWYDAPVSLAPGELWQFELRLRRPRGSSNPGVFDYETWLFRERAGATGYVVNGKRNQRLGVEPGRLLEHRRERFVDRVTSLIDDPAVAAVLAAVAVGARHLVTREQWARYSQSGTSHLMAISGLHIGLAAGAAYYLALAGLILLRMRANHRRIAFGGAMLVAAGYAALSGFAVPAERATLMFALLAVASTTAREPDGIRILAGTCVFVVLDDPIATLKPGFMLSFSAVLLLFWLAKRRQRNAGGSNLANISRFVRSLAAVQGFLLIGLMPLTILLFNRVSFIAPLANFVAVPLFSLVTVPLTLAGLVLGGAAAPFGDILLRTAAASIDLLERLISLLLSLPYASFVTPRIAGVAWLYLLLLLMWVLLPRGWPGRSVAWLGLPAIAAHHVDGPPSGCFDTSVLDVGQGLAVVVRTQDRVLLYDTGAAYRGGTSAATRIILPYLAGQGIDRIDRLVVSHSDVDHAGGLGAILAGMETGDVLVGEILDDAAGLACGRGQAWNWNGVDFRVLHPAPHEGFSGNNASCVLRVAVGESRILLTGDIEGRAEQALLADPDALQAVAVVVPHHGSNTSSSRAFVAAVAAEFALVSAGYGNRWGLPKPEVVDRWRGAGADVLTTARSGAISLRLCDDGGVTELRRNRELARRIWHEPVRE